MGDGYRYSNDKNYEWLFIKPEEKARLIQQRIGEIINNNSNDADLVKAGLREDVGDGVEFYDDSYLMDLISIMYSKESCEFKDKILEFIATFDNIKVIKKNGNFTQIETNEGTIEFASISEIIRKSGKLDGSERSNRALKDFYDDVESLEKRKNKCHELSLIATDLLKSKFNTDNFLVTGYPHYYVPENKYLHSWVELKIRGKDFVLDFTKNTLIDKDSYYRLHHIEDKDICSIISSEEIMEDKSALGDFFDVLDFKTYLTSRHEIVRDLDKNKHLFDGSDKESGEAR